VFSLTIVHSRYFPLFLWERRSIGTLDEWEISLQFENWGEKRQQRDMERKTLVVGLVPLFLLASVCAFAGDKAEVKGIISGRTGDTLIVNTKEGDRTTVVLTDDTTTQDRKGLFGLDKQILSNTVLIPGLKVKVSGTSDDQGRIVAKTITTDGDDLETAQMIQAGLHPTAEQVNANMQAIETNRQGIAANKAENVEQGQDIQANQQNIAANKAQIDQNMSEIEEHTKRFMALSEYDVKAETSLKFETGSSRLDSKDQQQLKDLAQKAAGINGYIIEVVGYADSTGSAAMNTRLSEDRAKATASYLVQQCNVPVRHIVAPGAMGEYGMGSNETKEARAENRRVEVKVLVNKGIAGS